MNGGLRIGPHPPSQYNDISALQWYDRYNYGWKRIVADPGKEPQLQNFDGLLTAQGWDARNFHHIEWKVNKSTLILQSIIKPSTI